jgi:serine/threonine protein phosphatase PrpC
VAQNGVQDGSTCLTAMIQQGQLRVASLGDSICTLMKHDGTFVRLSQEHSTKSIDESRRIYSSQGHIIRNRVEGELFVTRAIGN